MKGNHTGEMENKQIYKTAKKDIESEVGNNKLTIHDKIRS